MGGAVELISPVANGGGTQFRLTVPLPTAVIAL